MDASFFVPEATLQRALEIEFVCSPFALGSVADEEPSWRSARPLLIGSDSCAQKGPTSTDESSPARARKLVQLV